MSKTLLAGSVFLIAASMSAHGADLGVKKTAAAAPVPTAYNWSGVYAGLNLGYGFGHASASGMSGGGQSLLGGEGGIVSVPNKTVNVSGALAGAELGFLLQSGNIVYGVAADYAFSAIKGSGPLTFPGALYDVRLGQKLTGLGTVRLRGGFAADKLFVYGTGGFAMAQADTSVIVSGAPGTLHDKTTAKGWTVGGGVEYALGSNFTVKAEYLRVRLNQKAFGVADDTDGVLGGQIKRDVNLVRAGLNFYFK